MATLCFIQSRNRSDMKSLANFKKGTGGRSSFSGVVATVFGATGFLGKKIVSRLGKTGSQVIVPRRGDFLEPDALKLSGDLGQILYLDYDLRDEESLRKAMAYSNVVINLIGRDFETRRFKYQDVHVDGARRIARIAKELGVEKFVHFSSLNAVPNPQSIFIRGGSKFLKSKYEGELAVREEFPEAIIFRPADMFGDYDNFINLYMHQFRRTSNYKLPLWKKGYSTIKQPVYVADVATGVMNALRMDEANGNTYECVGPRRYYLSDLVDYFWQCARFPGANGTARLTLNQWSLFRLRAEFFDKVQMATHGCPPYTWDRIEREHITDRTTGLPTLEALNVHLTPIETVAPNQLQPYIVGHFFTESVEEYAPAPETVPTEFTPKPDKLSLAVPVIEIAQSVVRSKIPFELAVCGVFIYIFAEYSMYL